MRSEATPFSDAITPGSTVMSLEALTPLAAMAVGSSWHNEAVLVGMDHRWRCLPKLIMVTDVPSMPELLETLLTWTDTLGRHTPHPLGMQRVACVSRGVPFRIDPSFDWFDCDAAASAARVQLVEWIALDPHSTLLPRRLAGMASRWPEP